MKSVSQIKKILITGGSGMVGRNFIEHPDIENYIILNPTRNEMNLMNFQQIKQYLNKNKPDLIIHAAGKVGGILANLNAPIDFLIQNSEMGKNITLAARENEIKNLINLSSSCVYPKNMIKKIKETDILTGQLEPSNEAYAIGKIYVQKLCEYIHREDNSYSYKTLIPCNLFGKYDNFDLKTGHLLANIINKVYSAKQNKKKEIEVWGDGSVRREFMLASEFIDCLFFCIKNFNRLPYNLNVGKGYDYTILEYYEAVANELNWKGNFKYNLSKPVGQKRKLVSVEKLNKFGWYSKTSLSEAIKKTIMYYKKSFLNEI